VDPKAAPHPQLGTTSLLDYAADLEADIRKLDEPPILIGHSMGGLLAQMLAARGLAQAAILLTPASPSGIMAIRYSVLKSSWSALTRWAFWRKPYRLTYDEVAYGMMQCLSEENRRAEYEKMVFESGRASGEVGFWLFDRQHASRVDAAKVTCPMLVVGAVHDRHVPASIVRKVLKRYRHVAEYKEFANHAHWVIGEPGWQEIAQSCVEWLQDHAQPTASSRCASHPE